MTLEAVAYTVSRLPYHVNAMLNAPTGMKILFYISFSFKELFVICSKEASHNQTSFFHHIGKTLSLLWLPRYFHFLIEFIFNLLPVTFQDKKGERKAPPYKEVPIR